MEYGLAVFAAVLGVLCFLAITVMLVAGALYVSICLWKELR
jgi:hypothetical protein